MSSKTKKLTRKSLENMFARKKEKVRYWKRKAKDSRNKYMDMKESKKKLRALSRKRKERSRSRKRKCVKRKQKCVKRKQKIKALTIQIEVRSGCFGLTTNTGFKFSEDEGPCPICYDKEIGPNQHTKLTCGHALCFECAEKLQKTTQICPFCREQIKDVEMIRVLSKKIKTRGEPIRSVPLYAIDQDVDVNDERVIGGRESPIPITRSAFTSMGEPMRQRAVGYDLDSPDYSPSSPQYSPSSPQFPS